MLLRVSPRLIGYRRALILGVNVAIIPLAYAAAFTLRFEFHPPPAEWAHFWTTVPYLLGLRLLVFQVLGLHRGYWQHVGLRDLLDLLVAVTLSSALFVMSLFVVGLFHGMPRSVFLLDWLLMVFLSGGIRFTARTLREGQLTLRRTSGTRTFIIGAGVAGEQLLRQLSHERRSTLHVVGLIDDDPDTHGRTLHGVPVVGSTAGLPELVLRHDIALLVIAIRSATAEQTRQIVARCQAAGVAFKIIPSIDELLAGRAEISQLRDVRIDDLLGREPVELDLAQVKQDLAGKCILVTGGAGSIGSELARQIAGYGPARLVLLERAESPLYFTHLEVAAAHPAVEVVPFIASITNPDRLEEVFQRYRPDYVFHTAAYKHVPMLETNVVEAVWNNVFGTLRVAECAARHQVAKFVLISTDKAVNPTSILGATKRIAERIVQELPALQQSHTDFRVVRFGNVLDSDGSVVPVFKRQISAGGPVQVTHPDVQRYFMTIPEAVQLVLNAAALPEAARRVAILEMGQPVRIVDLAEQLIRLSGLVPYHDIQIVFTGLRPGEKLNEELVAVGEDPVPTSVAKIRIIQPNGVHGAQVEPGLARLLAVLVQGDSDELIQAVSGLVPDYVRWRSDPSLPTATPVTDGEPSRPTEPRRSEPAVPVAVSSAFARARARPGIMPGSATG
jgi:FlaA1/EpsC-like NDP-sugar epimerase